MDWTNKNVNPSKVVQLGDELEVMVLDVDGERRRISLGIKQCTPNPWEAFSALHKKGDKVSGQIKSITDFGIFIGLDGGIDGLVHLSDISWNTTGEDVVRNFKKGDTLEAVVLAVDPERERISLGVKQLEQDPVGQYMATTQKGQIVTGVVKEVDAKGATIELDGGIEGYVRANDIAKERVDDATQYLKVGDKVEAKFIGMDRKGRTMQLSIRAKDEAELQENLAEVNKSFDASSGTTKLGALLREQLNKGE
jgi:small subunit ribosomal protein S1